eukprot:3007498-Alexandrium_andersonii.AAC.1
MAERRCSAARRPRPVGSGLMTGRPAALPPARRQPAPPCGQRARSPARAPLLLPGRPGAASPCGGKGSPWQA